MEQPLTMPVTLSIRRCYSAALAAFGDKLVWLGILNVSYFLVDRAVALVGQQDPTGWIGTAASLAGLLVAVAYVVVLVVALYRLAAGLPLDRAVWRSSWAVGPAMFRWFVVYLLLVAALAIPCHVGLTAVYDAQVAEQLTLPVATVLLTPFWTGLAFSGWYVVEGLKVRDAFKASWRLTKGHFGKVALLTLFGGVAGVLSPLAANQGVWEDLAMWLQTMVLYPLTNLALAFAFFTLRGRPNVQDAPPGLDPVQSA
jgi:uncharacterized membrane protein